MAGCYWRLEIKKGFELTESIIITTQQGCFWSVRVQAQPWSLPVTERLPVWFQTCLTWPRTTSPYHMTCFWVYLYSSESWPAAHTWVKEIPVKTEFPGFCLLRKSIQNWACKRRTLHPYLDINYWWCTELLKAYLILQEDSFLVTDDFRWTKFQTLCSQMLTFRKVLNCKWFLSTWDTNDFCLIEKITQRLHFVVLEARKQLCI